MLPSLNARQLGADELEQAIGDVVRTAREDSAAAAAGEYMHSQFAVRAVAFIPGASSSSSEIVSPLLVLSCLFRALSPSLPACMCIFRFVTPA